MLQQQWETNTFPQLKSHWYKKQFPVYLFPLMQFLYIKNCPYIFIVSEQAWLLISFMILTKILMQHETKQLQYYKFPSILNMKINLTQASSLNSCQYFWSNSLNANWIATYAHPFSLSSTLCLFIIQRFFNLRLFCVIKDIS